MGSVQRSWGMFFLILLCALMSNIIAGMAFAGDLENDSCLSALHQHSVGQGSWSPLVQPVSSFPTSGAQDLVSSDHVAALQHFTAVFLLYPQVSHLQDLKAFQMSRLLRQK